MRRSYMCALSSFIFYWLLYAWMWFQEDQPDAGESLTSHSDTSTSPDSRQLDAVLAAARTATTGVALMFTGVMRGMSIHQQLLTTPTLWLILLLPPPAFLAVRVLRFPKLGRPVSEGWGQRALSACASACLWAGNAVLICLATVLACHVLSSLSSRPAMLALINWHELPPGASPDFPVHWAVYVGARVASVGVGGRSLAHALLLVVDWDSFRPATPVPGCFITCLSASPSVFSC